MRYLVLLTLLVSAVVLAPVAGGEPSSAIACGDTVTADLTLTADLVACSGDGLVVTGDHITVDLNGHTLSGTGAGVGISLAGANMVVENGAITGFETGISGFEAAATLRALSVRDNAGTGVKLFDCLTGATVERSVIARNGFWGLYAQHCPHLTVTDTHVVRNANTGVFLDFSAGGDDQFYRLDASENGGHGMTISGNSSTVSSSTFRRNHADGVTTSGHADGNVYFNNDFSNNGGDGLFISDSYSHVIGNTASANGRNGIFQTECCAQPGADIMAANIANDNGAAGIAACVESFPQTSCGPGIDDGGGNVAKHNAGPQQCINLTCALSRGRATEVVVPLPTVLGR